MEIKDLQGFCSELFTVQAELDDLNNTKSKLNEQAVELKKKILATLESNDLTNFDAGPEVGKVARVERRSVRIVDKYAFMDWLDRKGVLREMLTVAAPRANKIYNDAFDLAKENKDVSFLQDGIPGLSEPSVFIDIRKTKPKK